jgi:hypothetical protein
MHALDDQGPARQLAVAVMPITRALYEDESARVQGFETKASTLGGFAGAVLALDLSQGRALWRIDFGEFGEPVMKVAFLAASTLLTLAALLFLAMLRPQPRSAIDITAIDQLLADRDSANASTTVDTRMAGALKEMLTFERKQNERRATSLQRAGMLLALGVVAVCAQAVTLGVAKL